MATYYVDAVGGLDANAGTSAGAAKQTLGAGLGLLSAAGDLLYVKASGNYVLTSTASPTAVVKGDVTTGRVRVEGYTTTPGARDGRPTITSATNSVALITLNDNDFFEFCHLKFTHTAGTRGNAIVGVTSVTTPLYVRDCVFDGCAKAFTGSFVTNLHLESCEVLNSTVGGVQVGGGLYAYGCDIHDNTGDGISISNGTTGAVNLQDCILAKNTGTGANIGSTGVAVQFTAHGCVFADNTSDGLKFAANTAVNVLELENNIFYNNGGWGLNNLDELAAADASLRINRNNAYGTNTSGARSNLTAGQGDLSLSADPFTSRAGRDFSPNNTAGGGAVTRAAAFPASYPAGTTASYRDLGPAQHQDAGGSSTNVFLIEG